MTHSVQNLPATNVGSRGTAPHSAVMRRTSAPESLQPPNSALPLSSSTAMQPSDQLSMAELNGTPNSTCRQRSSASTRGEKKKRAAADKGAADLRRAIVQSLHLKQIKVLFGLCFGHRITEIALHQPTAQHSTQHKFRHSITKHDAATHRQYQFDAQWHAARRSTSGRGRGRGRGRGGIGWWCEQYVLWFEVGVNESVLMQKSQTHHLLTQHNTTTHISTSAKCTLHTTKEKATDQLKGDFARLIKRQRTARLLLLHPTNHTQNRPLNR